MSPRTNAEPILEVDIGIRVAVTPRCFSDQYPSFISTYTFHPFLYQQKMRSRCMLEVTDSELLNFLFSVRPQPSRAESLLFLHKKDQSYLLNKQEGFAASREVKECGFQTHDERDAARSPGLSGFSLLNLQYHPLSSAAVC